MKTQVTFTATSKNSGKQFTITVDLNDVKKGWFVKEANETLCENSMRANFTGYYAKANDEFRKTNEGVEVEVKKRIGRVCVLLEVYYEGVKMSEEIQNAIVGSANEGRIKIQRERINNIKDSDLIETKKESY